jgi:uncharacterized membrane protein
MKGGGWCGPVFLSVFVLLSQNRQAAKDRVRADVDGAPWVL